MESKKYCAYNKTQESFLSLRITVVDDSKGSPAEPVRALAGSPQVSLWLHAQGQIPAGFAPPGFDVVYLDEDCRVVDVVESRLNVASEPPNVQAASALALPPHTISATRTCRGDELLIWTSKPDLQPAGQKFRPYTSVRLKPIFSSLFPGKSTEPSPASVSAVRSQDAAPFVEPRKDAMEAEFEEAEFPAEERQSAMSRFKSWIASNLPQPSPSTPISILSSASELSESGTVSIPQRPAANLEEIPVPIASREEQISAPAASRRIDSRPIAPAWEPPADPLPDPPPMAPAPISNLRFVPSPAPIVPEALPVEPIVAPRPLTALAQMSSPARKTNERRQEPAPFIEDPSKAEATDTPSLMARFLRWLNAPPQASKRHNLPDLVAYYWNGGTPKPRQVVNISTSGLYLRTPERWLPDTVLVMNLQRTTGSPNDPDNRITVLSRVARFGEDGVGLQFVTSDAVRLRQDQILPGVGTDKAALQDFLKRFEHLERGA